MPSMKLVRLTNQRPADEQQRALDPPRQRRHDRSSAGRLAITMPTASAWQQRGAAQPEGADVVDRADDRDERSRGKQRQRAASRAGCACRSQDERRASGRERCADDGDAAALRRRLAVRGARIGMRQRIGLEPRPSSADQARR